MGPKRESSALSESQSFICFIWFQDTEDTETGKDTETNHEDMDVSALSYLCIIIIRE